MQNTDGYLLYSCYPELVIHDLRHHTQNNAVVTIEDFRCNGVKRRGRLVEIRPTQRYDTCLLVLDNPMIQTTDETDWIPMNHGELEIEDLYIFPNPTGEYGSGGKYLDVPVRIMFWTTTPPYDR